MCGLVGASASWLSTNEVAVVKKLLLVSSLRGLDSTGGFSVQKFPGNNEKSCTVYTRKLAIDPTGFITQPGPHQELFEGQFKEGNKTKQNIRVLALHNRYATVGEKTVKNAHPFSFPHIVGMHNGTVQGKFKHSDDYETDSEALFRNINDYGLEEGLSNVNQAVSAAYALVFFDKKKHTLNFIRNSLRPLAIATAGGCLYWASEKELLEYVLPREGLHPQTKPYNITPGTLYTLDISGKGWALDLKTSVPAIKSFQRPSYKHSGVPWQEDLETWNDWTKEGSKDKDAACKIPEVRYYQKTFPNPQVNNTNWPPTPGMYGSRVSAAVAEVKKEVREVLDQVLGKEEQGTFHGRGPLPATRDTHLRGYGGIFMSETYMSNLLMQGCAFCGHQTPCTDFDVGGVHWLDANTYLCESCGNQTELKEIMQVKDFRNTLKVFPDGTRKEDHKTPSIH